MRSELRAAAPNLAAAHAAGALGGLAAVWIGAPLPWLLGGLAGSAALAASLPRGVSGPWRPAQRLRNFFVVVIGVMIGGSVTPDVVGEFAGWWASLLGLVFYTIVAQLMIYGVYRRLGFDAPTAWFGAAPGGLIENIVLGEAAGADLRRLTLLQFGRIAATVTLVPLLYSLWIGKAVGSAAGEQYGAAAPLTALDVLILVAAGAAGWWVARRIRLPAGVIVGPVVASGAVHAFGLTHGQVPPEIVALAQLVVGVGIGLRFGGLTGREMATTFSLSVAAVVAMLALALAVALVAATASAAGPETLVLAYAPGGIIEMGLIALTLGASPVFVTAHHVVRVVMTVTIGPAIYRRFFRPWGD